MEWWEKVVFPVKQALIAVAGRVKPGRKSGAGILELHDDVRTCEYEDVHVMWEMLRTEMELSRAGAGPVRMVGLRPPGDVIDEGRRTPAPFVRRDESAGRKGTLQRDEARRHHFRRKKPVTR